MAHASVAGHETLRAEGVMDRAVESVEIRRDVDDLRAVLHKEALDELPLA
jgi:hypothetical protein